MSRPLPLYSATRGFLARQPLRRRVLALVLLLVTGVLAAGGVATTHALQRYLLNRTDGQLRQVAGQTRDALLHGDDDADRVQIPPEDAVRFVVSADGSRSAMLPATPGATEHVKDLSHAEQVRLAKEVPDSPRTFEDRALPGPYRLVATRFRNGARLVVGLPLRSLNDTVTRLLLIELAVGLAGLVVTAILGSTLIRVGLAPLGRMTTTTRRIAETDLTGPEAAVRLRAPVLPPQTEVGQLGSGMNHMLEAIDASFQARNEAERQLRQFIADASHELRTPLSTVRGYAELFDRSTRDRDGTLALAHDLDLAELGTAMRRIAEESNRMSLLVDDLLLLARLDQGRPLDHRPVDLCRLAVDAASDFRVRDEDRPIRLDLPADPLVVNGDEGRLRQVLANLLANVHAHTPIGTVVDLRVRSEDGDALVEVHDDGPGVPPVAIAHVFDRFYRADTSRTRASGGTGLGLAIVQAVIDAHHGTVRVSSRPGETTFRVRLPVV
ncbi:ATP-binding protein [Actinopolymorpha sp. NPDC004070]|uniref:sensor histidine kinase n=1 Tax=Actinopolymorpha sp. NPDC004070 TaxID=3154548 RepID=UPI0033AD387F